MRSKSKTILCLWAVTVSVVLAAPHADASAASRQEELAEVVVDLDMPFPENPEQVEALLEQVEENAIDVRQSAVRVLSFLEAPAEHTWLTHLWRINRAREAMEEVNEAVRRLTLRRGMLLDGQRAALDLIAPAAATLTMRLRETSEYLDRVRGRRLEPMYAALAVQIREEADTIVNAARLAESLSEVREQLEEIGSR